MNITPSASHAPPAVQAMAKPTAPAVGPAAKPVEAAQAVQAVRDKVQLQAPEKVDLGFDAKEVRQNLSEAIDRLNQQLQSNGRDLSFQMNEELNRPVITVHNIQTGEVVRKIPSEEVIRLAHSLEEGKGLFFNEAL
jgi:flagellar protein FlaG